MRIRLGTPYHSITNKDRIPNNQGMTEHVDREIEYNISSANQSYENALAADGVNILLYRKTSEGRRCTCKDSEPNQENKGSRFEEYQDNANRDKPSIRVKGSWDNTNRKQNFHKETLGVDIGSITPDDHSGRQEIVNFSTVDQDEVSAFLNGPLDSRALQSGDSTTACGICLGSGFTNGYSLYRGSRLTFDTINATKVRGFTTDKTKRPYVFTASGEAANQFIEWDFELPGYFIDTLNVQIRDNLSPAQDFKLLIGQNGNYGPATKQSINALKGNSGKYTLRVEPNNPNKRSLTFTHVELVLQFSAWIKTQIPQLASTTSFNTPESLYNIEVHLPPSVDQVSTQDILVDYKYNKAWVITDSTDLQTSKKQIIDWTLQTKSLATFDIRSLLKISRVPEYFVTFDGLRGDY